MNLKKKDSINMKLAFIGAGNRLTFQYAVNLNKHFSQEVNIVGVYDSNIVRAKQLSERLNAHVVVFASAETMLEMTQPDTVLIGTTDSTHDEYIELAMKYGCDVICEKPITTTPEKAKRIKVAQEKYQKKLTVTFNYRFNPIASLLKQVIQSSKIGQINSIHFEWMLDQHHGADYFRRWHRVKANSGGLQVHKSTHHFDFINWLLESKPESVVAYGELKFYGSQNNAYYGEHCRVCKHQNECPFFQNYNNDEEIKSLYYQAEHIDHYHRDGCVFHPEIDIEDTISALIHYENDVDLTYKLIAYAPYEGYNLSISGSEGRIEAKDYHGLAGPFANQQMYDLKIFFNDGRVEEIIVPVLEGSHGGGDDKMMTMLFSNQNIKDEFNQMADAQQGFNAAYIGMAINQSMKENRVVKIAEMEL